jgi:hypothetical protein
LLYPASLLSFASIDTLAITSSMLKSVLCMKTPGILTLRFRGAFRCPARVQGCCSMHYQEHSDEHFTQEPGDLRDKFWHPPGLLGLLLIFFLAQSFSCKAGASQERTPKLGLLSRLRARCYNPSAACRTGRPMGAARAASKPRGQAPRTHLPSHGRHMG